MSKVKVVLNSAGIRELLRSEEMRAVLEEQASRISSRCGAGYEHDTYLTEGRAVASVYAASDEAILDNLENNTILRSL